MNGLCVFRADATKGSSVTYPLNTELAGDNSLKLVMYPVLLETGILSTPADIVIEGAVKCYNAGDVTGPECGDLILSIDIEDIQGAFEPEALSVQQLKDLFPLTKTFEFKNEGVIFKNRLIDAPVITDKNKVVEYALKLRDIIKRQDLESLYIEYLPKLDDYARAYPDEFPDPKGWFTNLFRDDFFPGGPIVEFDRDEIVTRPWCDGRIWEVCRKPYQPFFMNKGLDGDINMIELYVGMVDGKMKIIR
jgi:hypothetical protein